MTIRAPVPGLAAGRVELSAETSHHLCRVLRLRERDRFVGFDPARKIEADGTIDVASGEAAIATFAETRPAAVIARAALVLVYAHAKGDKVDAVVRDATELGATLVVIAQTERAIVKADPARAATKLDRWRRIAEQAARQSGRGDAPAIEGVLPWSDALALAAKHATTRYCLWENATAPLGDSLPSSVASNAAIALAVGPEGGLTHAEVEEAQRHGFASVSLGSFVLRTETVPTAVLGAVRVLAGS